MTPWLGLARAFLVRDFLIDASYKVSLALEALDVGISVAAFYYLSRVIGIGRPDGYEVFAFLLLGLAVNNAMSSSLVCFTQAMKTDQQSGAIKPLMMSPLPPAAIVAASAFYPICRSLFSIVAFLGAGWAFGVDYGGANLAGAVVVGAVALAAFAAIGLLSAACTMVMKRGDPLLWLFAAFSWLLGGVFFPVTLLPQALQRAAALFPLTHALTALRATLLGGATLASVSGEVTVLAAIAVIGLPLGALTVQFGTAYVKRTGTLGHC